MNILDDKNETKIQEFPTTFPSGSRIIDQIMIDDSEVGRGTHAQDDSMNNLHVQELEHEDNTNVQELPPVDRGFSAWAFCASAFLLETIIWGFGFSYGVFQSYYSTHPPFNELSQLGVAAVGPTNLAIMFGEGIVLSLIHVRYPDLIKRIMWFGLGLCSLCLASSSFVSQVWLLVLLQGVGLGMGGGMLYWPVIDLVAQWFVEKRGLAGGIIFAGSGVGGFLFPFISNALLEHVGFRWTIRIFAVFQAIFGGLALLAIRPRIPIPKYGRTLSRPPFIPNRLKFFNRPVFWTYSLTSFLQAMSYFPVSLYVAVFTTSISSPLSATVVVSLFNSAGVVGQILIGYLTDRFPYPYIMFASALGSSLAAFLLWGFADTLARVFAFSIIFGCLSGGFPSVAFRAALDSSGSNPEQAPMALTSFMFVKGIAAIVGPVVSGLLLEAGKSSDVGTRFGRFGFGPVEIFVGSCAAATSLSSLVVAAVRPGIRTCS